MAEGKYVSVAEVKEMLTEENEKRGELIPSLKAALTAATETCPLTKEQADALIEKIGEIITELPLGDDSRSFIPVKIADTLPRSPAEVRSLFTKERGVTLSEDIIKSILNAVNEITN